VLTEQQIGRQAVATLWSKLVYVLTGEWCVYPHIAQKRTLPLSQLALQYDRPRYVSEKTWTTFQNWIDTLVD